MLLNAKSREKKPFFRKVEGKLLKAFIFREIKNEDEHEFKIDFLECEWN